MGRPKSKTLTLHGLEYYKANARILLATIQAFDPSVRITEADVETVAVLNKIYHERGIDNPTGPEGRLAIAEELGIGKAAVSLRLTSLVDQRLAEKAGQRGPVKTQAALRLFQDQEEWNIKFINGDYDKDHGPFGPAGQ